VGGEEIKTEVAQRRWFAEGIEICIVTKSDGSGEVHYPKLELRGEGTVAFLLGGYGQILR
jgi:hypothetical protein